jgi:hypothetical protein
MMTSKWYKSVSASVPLTQGDIILDCPVAGWSETDISFDGQNELELLRSAREEYKIDAIVMTQACDLANNKTSNVILCPHEALSDYRKSWDEKLEANGKKHTDKEFRGLFKQLIDGRVWNQAVLNSGSDGGLSTEHRLVDFSEVYSVPRTFLDRLITNRDNERLTLMPPYREYLSQAFARFFMRVGLPTPVEDPFAT